MSIQTSLHGGSLLCSLILAGDFGWMSPLSQLREVLLPDFLQVSWLKRPVKMQRMSTGVYLAFVLGDVSLFYLLVPVLLA